MEKEIANEILNHRSSILVDNSITRDQNSTFIPQSKADFNAPNSTIEIDIPASDSYYVPSESFLK